MKYTVPVLTSLLASLSLSRSQNLETPPLSLSGDGQQRIFLEWPGQKGTSDILETSTTTSDWVSALSGPLYGTGAVQRIHIGDRVAGTTALPAADRAHFMIQTFAPEAGSAVSVVTIPSDGAVPAATLLQALDLQAGHTSGTDADAVQDSASGKWLTTLCVHSAGPRPASIVLTNPATISPAQIVWRDLLIARRQELVNSRTTPVAAVTGAVSDLAQPRRYYRVRRLAVDTDLDGLTDVAELAAGLNPLSTDSDGDGFTDQMDTAPADFYNGIAPVITAEGSGLADALRSAAADTFMPRPVRFLVTRAAGGTPIPNAPVTFSITTGNGGLHSAAFSATTSYATTSTMLRTDAQGYITLHWKAGSTTGPQILRATSNSTPSATTALLGYSVLALPALTNVAAHLRPEVSLTTESGTALVQTWDDTARSVHAVSSGALRPSLNTTGAWPLVSFSGTQRLQAPDAMGTATSTAIFIANPGATRTATGVSANDYGMRLAGKTGQRYLLTGTPSTAASPFNVTPESGGDLVSTRRFSHYTHKYFTAPGTQYSALPITPTYVKSGQTAPETRYDITASTNTRLNPTLNNVPRKAGASISACANDFKTAKGLSTSLTWVTQEVGSWEYLSGTVSQLTFSEKYYELRGYSPVVPASYTLVPSRIGGIGQGWSIATNGSSWFHLGTNYSPGLGQWTQSVNGMRLYTASWSSGVPQLYINGIAASGSSTAAPAGGTFSGIRYIGAMEDGTQGFSGTMGDLLILTGTPTTQERQNAEDTIAARYWHATPDRDGDQMPDWWEKQFFAAGTATSANANTDGDTLTHLQEWQRHTHPGVADTDMDGIADGTETAINAITP